MSLMLLVPIKWANRTWALPFFTVLAPSQRYYEGKPRSHKKLTDWAQQMIGQVHRWLGQRKLIIVADSSYTCYDLLGGIGSQVAIISPLRIDARLFDFPAPRPKGKRGRKPIVGLRQLTLSQRLEDPKSEWKTITITQWYGQQNKRLEVLSGTAIWYKSGIPAVPNRWVLIKAPQGKQNPKL